MRSLRDKLWRVSVSPNQVIPETEDHPFETRTSVIEVLSCGTFELSLLWISSCVRVGWLLGRGFPHNSNYTLPHPDSRLAGKLSRRQNIFWLFTLFLIYPLYLMKKWNNYINSTNFKGTTMCFKASTEQTWRLSGLYPKMQSALLSTSQETVLLISIHHDGHIYISRTLIFRKRERDVVLR